MNNFIYLTLIYIRIEFTVTFITKICTEIHSICILIGLVCCNLLERIDLKGIKMP
jgi:hypothetical protein